MAEKKMVRLFDLDWMDGHAAERHHFEEWLADQKSVCVMVWRSLDAGHGELKLEACFTVTPEEFKNAEVVEDKSGAMVNLMSHDEFNFVSASWCAYSYVYEPREW